MDLKPVIVRGYPDLIVQIRPARQWYEPIEDEL
jgi:hypothetical protein